MPKATSLRLAHLVGRAKRLGLVPLVAGTTLAAATTVMGTVGASRAVGEPIVTLFASPNGTSRGCTSLPEACNLTHALATATAPTDNGDAVTVMVAPGTYYESSIDIEASSLASLTVMGAGASVTSVRPGMASAFLITGGAITLSGLSIDASARSAIAVRTDGTAPGTDLTVTDDAFTADRGVNGGAITGDIGSQITVNDDTFSNDTASFGDGGAVFSQGALVATEDTFSGDSAALYGGALFAQGDLAADDDTFVDDSAASGGAVATQPPPQSTTAAAWLANDTFVADKATADVLGLGTGGALANLGSIVSATQDTFSADTAATSQGAVLRNQGSFTLSNSIIDVPEGAVSCDGMATDGGYNVESDDSCGLGPTDDPSSLVDVTDIDLPPSLAPNGSSGPETLAISPNSPAFDEVPASACVVNSDERGWPRPGAGGSSCDAGAFEYLQLTVHVSGSEPYLSSNPSFTFSVQAPPGASVQGTLSCLTANGGLPVTTLGLGDYTVDGASCSGLSVAGTASESTGVTYVGAPNGFEVNANPENNEKLASNFLGYAESVLGDPYVWGQGRSMGATSFDCSGLVVYSLLNLGYSSVPLDTYSQFAWATPLSIEEAYNTPGALLFGQFGEDGVPGPGHVAISLGNGDIIEAAHTGTNVSIVPVSLTAGGIVTTGQPDVGDLFTRAGLIPGLDYNLGIDGIEGAAATNSVNTG